MAAEDRRTTRERPAARWALALLAALLAERSAAQDIAFSTESLGVVKSIATWGLDTAWPSPDNMRHGLQHMGADQVDVVRANFYIDEPLQADGTLGPNAVTRLNTQLGIAAMAGAPPIALTPNTEDTTDPWYLNGNQARVDRWTQLIQATRSYVEQQGWNVIEVEPFNEPDFWAGQGTPQNLRDVMTALRADPDFAGVAMVGPSTLSSDEFAGWYSAVSGPADYGSTHQLAGATDSYVNFIQQVQAAGDTPYNPEVHSFAEVLYGAEYGLEGGVWWGEVLLGRGLLVNSVQGRRLGYAEDRGTGTAAAVYRDPDGALRAFAGGFERDYQGSPRMYRVAVTDRDVYFNGVGPIREYMLYAGQSPFGSYADIQDEAEAAPALDGARWKIVNRHTGEVLQVAGAGMDNGADIRLGADAGALHQRWDVQRTTDGYLALTAAHSGRTAEIADWSIDVGANARQWGMGDNILQRWFVEQAGDGYFYLRNGHSHKFLTSGSGGTVYQNNAARNRAAQQWEFVLANPDPDDTIAAHYEFEGDGRDSTGANHASVLGGAGYAAGAIELDGSNDYVTLPAGIADSDDLTVAAWVRWDGGDAWQRVFDFGDDTSANLFLTPRSGAGTMRVAIKADDDSGEQYLETDPLPTGEWVHLAFTLGGNTGVLYVNGAPRVAGQILLDPSDFDPDNNYLGRSQYPDPLFDGAIDDFRVYHHALDAGQIAQLVRLGDYNGDGLVDAADYTVIRDGLGVTYHESDLERWRENYGADYGAPATGVPEPGGVVLLLAALVAAARRR